MPGGSKGARDLTEMSRFALATDATEAAELEPAADPRAAELALVDRHRHGDPDAFLELYRTHAGMAYSVALRMSGDPDEAADLTQEIFLRVFRHLGRFRGGSRLKTWLYRVALNHCRSKLGRRRPSGPSLDDEETRIEAVDPRRNPEERAASGERAHQLSRALLALDPVFREAVVLRDVEELGYEEIAQVLRVPIGTVRSRIARGRARLREIVLEEER